MVAIRPFCALRYNPEQISDLSEVIAPPYDVISPEHQERLYQASPYNVVRLILSRQFPRDTPTDNRYTRARRDFEAWRKAGVLVADPIPSLYLIQHTFSDEGQRRSRLGFIALLELGEDIERQVYRHETTLASPREDRMKLLEAVPANLSPIFCVYPDAQGFIHSVLQAQTLEAPPLARAAFNGDMVQVWALTDTRLIHAVADRLRSIAVFIADGHHRFEVACGKRTQYSHVMSYFVSMADPSLIVRPIHRIIWHPALARLDAIRQICQLEPAPDLPSVLQWLQHGPPSSETAEGAGAPHGRFGYSDGNALYHATVHPDRLGRWLSAPSMPGPVAALDVSILHGLILPALTGAAPGSDRQALVTYTPRATEALETVARARGSSMWLLRSIPVDQIYALAAQGLTLPPKSTYFSPKVPSGLTIHSLA